MKQRSYGYQAPTSRSSRQASSLGLLFWFIVILFVLVCIAVVHMAGGTANFLYDMNHLSLFLHQIFLQVSTGK